MDSVRIDNILELRPDTVQYIRKLYNLDKPESLDDSINILNEWIQKQPHFNKKDFSKRYLETTLIVNKGSLERAKVQLDKMCTLKTVLPQFFGNYNVKTDFEQLHEVIKTVVLPKLTDDHYRVNVMKYYDVEWKASQAIHFYRHNIILAEYLRAHDYIHGIIAIIDLSDTNLISLLKKLNPVEIRQSISIYIDCYGVRIKKIHIISESTFVDGIVTILKSVMSAKLASRIDVHKSFEELHKFIPKAILPIDYGGEERSLETLQKEFIEVLSSQAHLDQVKEMNKATTNESYRQKDQFSEHYAGMPGTFKFLSVD
ncbi:alpha-tocopherol transfer protein-like [Pararge aegeria]|uniref:alpha-tocopherol transfer protein-like n=1 Tax=Pararge aegeria TaxID=116150 RepID=UPI0019D143DA|nr:alpha-tocopherol transfer protein-like [Pararge aegeria]